jgi:Tfp pilus assembly protein PilN
MAEINLLKSELQARSKFSLSRASRVALYVVIVLLVLEGLLYGLIFFYERQVRKNILALDQENASTDFEIGKTEKDRLEAISFQTRLGNLKTLLDSHLFWSELLKELERVTYRGAQFTALGGDEGEQKLIISGSVPSYKDLAKLMLGLTTSPQVKDVVLGSSGLEKGTEGGYGFTLEVTFNPSVLSKP